MCIHTFKDAYTSVCMYVGMSACMHACIYLSIQFQSGWAFPVVTRQIGPNQTCFEIYGGRLVSGIEASDFGAMPCAVGPSLSTGDVRTLS